ncbi:hypothetical protein VrSk94_43320 [Vibrio rotiferianus]
MNKHEIQVRQKTDIVLAKSSKLMGLTNKILANRKSVAVAIKQGIIERRPDLVHLFTKLHAQDTNEGESGRVSTLSAYLAKAAEDWVNFVDWQEEGVHELMFDNPKFIIKDETYFDRLFLFRSILELNHEVTEDQALKHRSPLFTAWAACKGIISVAQAFGALTSHTQNGHYVNRAWKLLFRHAAVHEYFIDSDDGWMFEHNLQEYIAYDSLASNKNAEWSHNLVWEVVNATQDYSGKKWTIHRLISNPSISDDLKEAFFSHMDEIPCSTVTSKVATYDYLKRIAFAEKTDQPWSPEFIRKHRWELAMNELSSNEAVPWSKELIEEYMYDVNFHRLATNKGVIWDNELIETLTDPVWDWDINKVINYHNLGLGEQFIRDNMDTFIKKSLYETYEYAVSDIAGADYSGVSVEFLEELVSKGTFDDEVEGSCDVSHIWWVAAIGSFQITYSLKDLTFDEVNEIVTHVRGYGLALKDV